MPMNATSIPHRSDPLCSHPIKKTTSQWCQRLLAPLRWLLTSGRSGVDERAAGDFAVLEVCPENRKAQSRRDGSEEHVKIGDKAEPGQTIDLGPYVGKATNYTKLSTCPSSGPESSRGQAQFAPYFFEKIVCVEIGAAI
jgi:hypothetical protein